MDPHKTQMTPTGPIDPNRTQMVPGADVTQAVAAPSISVPRGVEVEIIPGRNYALANSPAREQFLVEIHGQGGGGSGTRTPLNICLVIDRSGSMEGEPLDYVKRACGYVVDLLSSEDVLSIVTFEETVEVLMPPRHVVNTDLVKEHINRIVPGNTTNLYDGLALGAQQVLSTPEQGLVTRLVVFSDGDPTAGIKDFGALVQHVAEIKKRGITCTFLGFGYDYNEELLSGMAKRSGGNYYFISRPELIPEVFREEMSKLFTIAARNVELQLKISRWVNLRQIYGHQVPTGQREATVELADLEKGSILDIAIDLEFQNHPLGVYRVASGVLKYDDSITGKREKIFLDFVIEFTADQAKCTVDQNPRVSRSVEVSLASRMVEKTVMGLKSGQITAAMAVADLQKTQMLLIQDGRTREAREVAQALRDLQAGNTQNVEKTLIGTVTSLDQGKRSSETE